MSGILFDGGKLVEGRHCCELGRILERDVERWNEFRQALGIPLEEVQTLVLRLKEPSCSSDEVKGMAASAFYEVIQLWIAKCPRNATFGALIDVLGRQLEFIDSANHGTKLELTRNGDEKGERDDLEESVIGCWIASQELPTLLLVYYETLFLPSTISEFLVVETPSPSSSVQVNSLSLMTAFNFPFILSIHRIS